MTVAFGSPTVRTGPLQSFESLEERVFTTVEAALGSTGVVRDEVDSVVLAADDIADGRAITTMLHATAAGAYFLDEIRTTNGSLTAQGDRHSGHPTPGRERRRQPRHQAVDPDGHGRRPGWSRRGPIASRSTPTAVAPAHRDVTGGTARRSRPGPRRSPARPRQPGPSGRGHRRQADGTSPALWVPRELAAHA